MDFKIKIITITIITFLTFTTICSSQIQNNPIYVNSYVGTWQNQNNNEVFEVVIWEKDTLTYGHYRKYIVDSNGVFQSEVFNSNKQLGTSNVNWTYTIYGGKYISAENSIIDDNTFTDGPNGQFIDGLFSMKIESLNSTTAIWKVKRPQGVTIGNVTEYSILTYCILIKQ